MVYALPVNRGWVQVKRKGYDVVCSDCGRLHTMKFRIRKGRIQFKSESFLIWIDHHNTSAVLKERT